MQLHKENQDFNGVLTRDLLITDAMLCQLSYEATDVGSGSIVGSYVPVKVTGSNPVEVQNFFFLSGFFTQLHKLRSLRRSFLHFHFISAVHI